jgi:hypothetical protein
MECPKDQETHGETTKGEAESETAYEVIVPGKYHEPIEKGFPPVIKMLINERNYTYICEQERKEKRSIKEEP